MGYKFTNSHINNTLKKDSAFFINSENIDRASNKLIGHLIKLSIELSIIKLSIAAVYSNALPEMKNIRLEMVNIFDSSFKCIFVKSNIDILLLSETKRDKSFPKNNSKYNFIKHFVLIKQLRGWSDILRK